MSVVFNEALLTEIAGVGPNAWYPGINAIPLFLPDESTINDGFSFNINLAGSQYIQGTPFTEMQYLERIFTSYTRSYSAVNTWFGDQATGTIAFMTTMLNRTNFPASGAERVLLDYGRFANQRFRMEQTATGTFKIFMSSVRNANTGEITIESSIPIDFELDEFHPVVFSWDFTKTSPLEQWQLSIGGLDARENGVTTVAGDPITSASGTPLNPNPYEYHYLFANWASAGSAPVGCQLGNLIFWMGTSLSAEQSSDLSSYMTGVVPFDPNDDRILTHLETAKSLFVQQFKNVRTI